MVQKISSDLVSLIDQLPFPLMVTSSQAAIVTCNQQWQNKIGMMALTPQQLAKTPEKNHQPWYELVTQAIDSHQHIQEWQLHKIPLALPNNNFDQDHDTGWLIMAMDVTNERQMQAELAHKTADLEHLQRIKDEFLACITHELKTPLTTLIGWSSLLQHPTIGSLNQNQARFAKLIQNSSQHLSSLIDQILTLTQMEIGQISLKPRTIKITQICEQAYHRAIEQSSHQQGSLSTGTSLEFSLEIESGLEVIIADEIRLEQMLVHLLVNAIKFTPENGKIGLQVEQWQGWIAFIIWDTGIGIPIDKQHLIFQKFQQLESPLTRQFAGTGLGLVLTQRLARLHGGDVSFLSQPNQGSQFTLLLPPEPPINHRSLQPITVNNSIPNQLVLIVEPLANQITELEKNLTSLGYRVVIARTGPEAIDRARQLQPKMIFLNPILPLLSGGDVIILLKNSNLTKNIPIILTSGINDLEPTILSLISGSLPLPTDIYDLEKYLEKLQNSISLPPLIKVDIDRSITILIIQSLKTNEHDPYQSLLNQLTEENDRNLSVNYDILVANDFQQASILADFWHPHVLILGDSYQVNDPSYFPEFKKYPNLTSLPIVTFENIVDKYPQSVFNLNLFPYIAVNHQPNMNDLIPIIQQAAGILVYPRLLLINLSNSDHNSSDLMPNSLNTLSQYLSTAGFQTLFSQDFQSTIERIHHHPFHLIILGWDNNSDRKPNQNTIKELIKIVNLPPIIILDYRSSVTKKNQVNLLKIAQELKAKIIPANSLSIANLLPTINELIIN